MQDLRKKIFRSADAVTSSDGLSGRGVIFLKTEKDNYYGIRDELIEGGHFIYMGDTDFKTGSVLTYCGERYIVLAANRLQAFGKCFCSRGILERVKGYE